MPPNQHHNGSPAIRNGRKRANPSLSILPDSEDSSTTTAASFTRQNNYRPGPHTATPASAFFPLISANGNAVPRPTPEAQAHFSHSSTLRRHPDYSLSSPAGIASAVNAEAAGIWQRLVGMITGRPSQESKLEDGEASPQVPKLDKRDTLSARFAHSTIDVSLRTIVPCSVNVH
jgi:Ca2+-transporting ATPase